MVQRGSDGRTPGSHPHRRTPQDPWRRRQCRRDARLDHMTSGRSQPCRSPRPQPGRRPEIIWHHVRLVGRQRHPQRDGNGPCSDFIQAVSKCLATPDQERHLDRERRHADRERRWRAQARMERGCASSSGSMGDALLVDGSTSILLAVIAATPLSIPAVNHVHGPLARPAHAAPRGGQLVRPAAESCPPSTQLRSAPSGRSARTS